MRRGRGNLLAPRQYRRHALTHHPPRLDDAPPTHQRAEGGRRGRPRRRPALDRPRNRGGPHRRPRPSPRQNPLTSNEDTKATKKNSAPRRHGEHGEGELAGKADLLVLSASVVNLAFVPFVSSWFERCFSPI